MRSTLFLLIGCVHLATAASVRAEDPKFAQLKTKALVTAAAPDLKGGLVFPGGAFDLSSSPSAMILANFEPNKGVRFVHIKMIYQGEYTDPNTNIKGYLYHLKDKTYDRYFFISMSGVANADVSKRHVIDYNDSGNPLAYFQGTFAANP